MQSMIATMAGKGKGKGKGKVQDWMQGRIKKPANEAQITNTPDVQIPTGPNVVYVIGFEKETPLADIKRHFQRAGIVKAVQKNSKFATVTYASAVQAQGAIRQLDKSHI